MSFKLKIPKFSLLNNFETGPKKAYFFRYFRKVNHGQRTTFRKGPSRNSKKSTFFCWYRGILLYNVRIVQWCTFKAGARQGKGKGVKDLGRIYGGVAHLQPKCFHCTAHQHSTGPHDFTFALHRTRPHDHTTQQNTRPHHMTTQNSTAPHDFTFGLHSNHCTVILDAML